MDTLNVALSAAQFYKLVELLQTEAVGGEWSGGQIALLAAFIGGAVAVIPNFFSHIWTSRKEIKFKKMELVAEERRIAELLREHYKELVMYKVHKSYYYRLYQLSKIKEHETDHLNSSKQSDVKAFETLRIIMQLRAQYVKVVSSFVLLTGANKTIEENLVLLRSFEPNKVSKFNHVTDDDDLQAELEREEKSVNENYLRFSEKMSVVSISMRCRLK